MSTALERAFAEGRNVLPNASDDDAATIEAWARDALGGQDPTEVTRGIGLTLPPVPAWYTWEVHERLGLFLLGIALGSWLGLFR